ncbi:MAG: alpha/beta hydrolase, partial [Alphaproteobacteria bacterium]|nr:alpha/beta hydrolase [Alphaproteobacteria bacterium]
CAGKNVLSDYRFQTQTVPPYIIASWFKIEKPESVLRIYIEGDGNAFNVKGQPTDNPTPKDTFLRTLAANDTNSNVAYLGRPCQYLQAGVCSQKDWTSGRFSDEIVSSMERAVLNLMKKAKTQKVVLIGFSGGAQVAGLIAVRNADKVQEIITIAGVLDHQAWTDYHGDEALTQSLNLMDYKKEFDKIPQRHFIGEKDDVVPPELTQEFVTDEKTIILVPKATHNKGFDKIAKNLYGVEEK